MVQDHVCETHLHELDVRVLPGGPLEFRVEGPGGCNVVVHRLRADVYRPDRPLVFSGAAMIEIRLKSKLSPGRN